MIRMQREKRTVKACRIHEASEGNEDSIGNQVQCHSCDILTKNRIPFSLCSENLSNFEFRDKRLICVKEDKRAGQKANITKPAAPKSRAGGKNCGHFVTRLHGTGPGTEHRNTWPRDKSPSLLVSRMHVEAGQENNRENIPLFHSYSFWLASRHGSQGQQTSWDPHRKEHGEKRELDL